MDKENVVHTYNGICMGYVWDMQYTHTKDSALNEKEILSCATTWMNLEDIMPSKTSELPQDKYCMVPLM